MANRILLLVTVALFHFEIRNVPSFPGVEASSFWNVGTVITTAADLLEQSDLLIRDRNDPLLRVIEESSHRLQGEASYEKLLLPLLSDSIGFNNQLMEYMTAAVVGRATNRTLCLTPFNIGPPRHADKWNRRRSLAIEDHYDVMYLSKFVRVSYLERCLKMCNQKLHQLLLLRGVRQLNIPKWDVDTKPHNLDWSFVNWTSTSDITRALSSSRERCVALGGLFPGLRWRGAFLATTEYLHPTSLILDAATTLRQKAIGLNESFLAVHWRFDESTYNGHPLGLYFIRCGDGSIVDSGLHPPAREWVQHSKRRCPGGVRGVAVATDDIIIAISDWAKKYNLHNVYLATDGWMRGTDSQLLLEEVLICLFLK
eukprot:c17746_g1_i2 orf=1078-2184(-)